MSTSPKYTVGIVVLTMVAWIMASGAVMAAEAAVRVDVNSAYVWRGITLNDGTVVQPSIDVGATSNLTINVWGNFNIDDFDGLYEKDEFSEVDLTVSYGISAGRVGFELGYAEYLYPHQGQTNGEAVHGTREVYLGAETAIVGDLALQGKVAYDTDETEGVYASVGLTYGASSEDETISAEIGASAGYADKKWAEGNSGGTEAGFHDYNVTIALAYAADESVSYGANLGYTGSIDEDVLPEQDVDLYGGVSVSVGF